MAVGKVELSEADRRKFNDDGYWISPKLIDDDRIERLRKAHERIWAGDHDGVGYPMNGHLVPNKDLARIRKIDNAFWINDEILAMVTDPIIGELAAELLETDEIRLWADQVIIKPGAGQEVTTAGNVGWHQDYGYWQTSTTTNMATIWIALQDTDLTNGGMMTILGSHKWGLIPGSDTFGDQNLQALREKYAGQGREWIEEPCNMKAGQASFHHSLTFHGSGPNQTTDPRMCVVAHVMPKGTAYRSGVQFHPNIRLLGPRPYEGQLFDNEYFPVVYSKNAVQR